MGFLVFLPLTRWRGVPYGLKLGVLATGMLQFGITYLCLYRSFGYFFYGALIIALPSFLIFGDASRLPATTLQWSVLFWLGLAASGAGLFLWNRGACYVDAGTLAIMNNVLVPAGLLVNLLIWNRDADLVRLAVGGGVIGFSLWLNAAFHPQARVDIKQTGGINDRS